MAELDDDKTHDPTPHRRQQAREQGQVARSQDVGSAILLCGAIGSLFWLSRPVVDVLGRLMMRQLGGEPWLAADIPFLVNCWQGVLSSLAVVLLPILGLMMLLAIAGNALQVGWLFLPAKALPDFSRVDPVTGIRRLFSFANVSQLLFAVAKLAVVGAVAWFSVIDQRERILHCGQLPLPALASFLAETILWTMLKIALALAVLAAFDYAYRRIRHERDLRMSPQELRAELRNLQGDTQTAARRRALWRQWSRGDLVKAVHSANVLVKDNRGHVIALRFNAQTQDAPVVVAKGSGAEGQRLLALAARGKIVSETREKLAERLFAVAEPNQPIPQNLYREVAALLAQGPQSARM